MKTQIRQDTCLELEEYIQESLKWCGFLPNEGFGAGGDVGPYKQSERKAAGLYKKYAQQLLDADKAYYAFDTPEELDQMREDLKKAGVAAPQYNAISRMRMKKLHLPFCRRSGKKNSKWRPICN